jgi:hypothetical protein
MIPKGFASVRSASRPRNSKPWSPEPISPVALRLPHRATITGPQADLNLGIKTFLNGTLVSNIVLDASSAATDTIDYVAADSAGVTATSTRIVFVSAPQAANGNQASSTPANDNTPRHSPQPAPPQPQASNDSKEAFKARLLI